MNEWSHQQYTRPQSKWRGFVRQQLCVGEGIQVKADLIVNVYTRPLQKKKKKGQALINQAGHIYFGRYKTDIHTI